MRDPDCLFCKIVAKEIPADVVLDRDDVLAFRDVNPQAPTHVLVIPKDHLKSLEAVGAGHEALLASLVDAVNEVARNDGVDGGFRVVTNIGAAAGQSVDHLHLHVLGGRPMRWPPG
ncbi:MAG TPA: histidine triad nucleotide-binding protein [Actinomycetota bacterium]|nr:histidine triad nucleotide-binding protein [Actinomycetota bacterium]